MLAVKSYLCVSFWLFHVPRRSVTPDVLQHWYSTLCPWECHCEAVLFYLDHSVYHLLNHSAETRYWNSGLVFQTKHWGYFSKADLHNLLPREKRNTVAQLSWSVNMEVLLISSKHFSSFYFSFQKWLRLHLNTLCCVESLLPIPKHAAKLIQDLFGL